MSTYWRANQGRRQDLGRQPRSSHPLRRPCSQARPPGGHADHWRRLRAPGRTARLRQRTGLLVRTGPAPGPGPAGLLVDVAARRGTDAVSVARRPSGTRWTLRALAAESACIASPRCCPSTTARSVSYLGPVSRTARAREGMPALGAAERARAHRTGDEPPTTEAVQRIALAAFSLTLDKRQARAALAQPHRPPATSEGVWALAEPMTAIALRRCLPSTSGPSTQKSSGFRPMSRSTRRRQPAGAAGACRAWSGGRSGHCWQLALFTRTSHEQNQAAAVRGRPDGPAWHDWPCPWPNEVRPS